MDIESCFLYQSFYSYLLYIYSFNESLRQSLNTSILPSRQPGPLAETQVHLQEINRTQWVCTFSVSHTLSKPALWRSFIQIEFHFVLTKTRNDLQQPPAIFNDTQWPQKIHENTQWPSLIQKKFTTVHNDPKEVHNEPRFKKIHNDPQWPIATQTTFNSNPQLLKSNRQSLPKIYSNPEQPTTTYNGQKNN